MNGMTVMKKRRPLSYRAMVQRPKVDYEETVTPRPPKPKRKRKYKLGYRPLYRRAVRAPGDMADPRWATMMEFLTYRIQCGSQKSYYDKRLLVLFDYLRRHVVRLEDVVGMHILHLIREMEEAQKGSSYIRTIVIVCNMFFQWAIANRKSGITINPVPARVSIKRKIRPVATLSPAQYEKLRAACRGKQPWEYLWVCSWETGARLGDVCLLSWDQVNWDKDFISFMPAKTRRHGTRVIIPMNDALRECLRQRLELRSGPEESFVCPELARRYLDPWQNLSTAVRNELTKAGVAGVSHKAFRHGYITRMLERGVPPAVVMSMSGHTNLQTVLKYMNVGLEAKRAAMKKGSEPINPNAPVEAWEEYLKK